MRTDPRTRAGGDRAVDPWRDAPTGELGDQVLPRWFVLTAIGCVVLAILVLAAAFAVPSRDTVPVEARRPPASQLYTTAVGEVQTGVSQPQAYDAPCPLLDGIRLAGSQTDRTLLRQGLAGLCNVTLPDDVATGIRAFGASEGIVRFATFEATGVDSTATRDAPATIFVNARFQRTNPLWIAPLIAHDATLRQGDPATAGGALAARRAEQAVCDRLLGDGERSRGCNEAEAILTLDDPAATLRAVGFE